MKKRLIVVAVLVALVGGVWWLASSDNPTDSANLSNNTYGSGSTGVELVEYGDFQCPVCGQFYPIVSQVKEVYKDRITFRFRHFPIQTAHPNARAAHRAAEAAAKQGKFWEMHNMLFENQSAWSSSTSVESIFEAYAAQIGLNVEQYKTDAAGSEVNSIINADSNLGGSNGVTGTPTFFIDGKMITNAEASSVESLSSLLDAAIAAKNGQSN